MRIALSEEGFALVDAAVTRHVETLTAMLATMTPRQRADLAALLGHLLTSLEGG